MLATHPAEGIGDLPRWVVVASRRGEPFADVSRGVKRRARGETRVRGGGCNVHRETIDLRQCVEQCLRCGVAVLIGAAAATTQLERRPLVEGALDTADAKFIQDSRRNDGRPLARIDVGIIGRRAVNSAWPYPGLNRIVDFPAH